MSIVSRAEILGYLQLASSVSEAQDGLLAMLAPMCERVVCDFLRLDIERAWHTELLPARSMIQPAMIDQLDVVNGQVVTIGGGTSRLQLSHAPILVSSVEVWEDTAANAGQAAGAFGDSTKLTAGTDFWLDADRDGFSGNGIICRQGAWPGMTRSVRVRYLAGLLVEELRGAFASIKLAVLLTVAKAFNTAKVAAENGGSGPLTMETIGKYSAQYQQYQSANLLSGMTVAIPIEAQQILQPYRSYANAL